MLLRRYTARIARVDLDDGTVHIRLSGITKPQAIELLRELDTEQEIHIESCFCEPTHARKDCPPRSVSCRCPAHKD